MSDPSEATSSPAAQYLPDLARVNRIGLDEAIFCSGKSPAQIAAIIERHSGATKPLLLTRLDEQRHEALPANLQGLLDFDPVSRTAVLGKPMPPTSPARIAIATAGTSDVPVAHEALRTLNFHGAAATEFNDIGVAGLWRLLERVEELNSFPVVIAIAGMDAALPTVLGGQVGSAIIGVPTSTGYGVATGGRSALDSMLTSCAPGISVVNIDNGYGAACAALRILNRFAPPE